MIRILQMIGSLTLGGSQSMIMNLYHYVDRSKIQFDFILDHPDELYLADEIKRLGGKIYFMPAFTGKNFIQIRTAWNQFFHFHSEYRILHSHVRSYASIYLPIAKKHGLITVIHSHSTSNGTGIQAVVKKILQYPLRYEADYFFGCSRLSGEWLFGSRVVNSNKYKTVKNAINVRKYMFDIDKRIKVQKKLGISEKNIVFGHVGRYHEAKNYPFLIDLFAKIRLRWENAKLILVGDGSLRNVIEDRIKEYRLEEDVLLLGMRNDICLLMQAMDVFLFPSKWEGLPITLVEAQASGLPCFVSDQITKEIGISELIQYLPINSGMEVWENAIYKADLSRKDVIFDIVRAGFDIRESGKWFTQFYTKIARE